MSQNIQFDAMLAPAQAVKNRPQAHSAHQNAENQTVSAESGENAVSRDLPRDKKRDGFDQLLNQKLEKTNEKRPESAGQAGDAAAVAAEDTMHFAAYFVPIQGINATEVQQNQAVTVTPQNPQSGAAGDPQVAVLQNAMADKTAETGTAQQVLPDGQNGFSAFLNAKTGMDGASPAGGAAVQAEGEVVLPDDNSLENKNLADKLPAVPQKAMENTDGSPVAEKSPNFQAQGEGETKEDIEAPELKGTREAGLQLENTEGDISSSQHPEAHNEASIALGQKQTQHQAEFTRTLHGRVDTIEVDGAAKIRAAEAVTASRPAEQIAEKMALEPKLRVDQQIRLTLTPAELGTVRMTFRQQDDEVVGMIEVQKPQTRKDLQESLPQLLTAMQNQGVQIRRIEVVQWNPPQQGGKDSLSDHFNPAAEREFLQQGTGSWREGQSQDANASQKDGYNTPGRSKQQILDTQDLRQWTSEKGLNLYI